MNKHELDRMNECGDEWPGKKITMTAHTNTLNS